MTEESKFRHGRPQSGQGTGRVSMQGGLANVFSSVSGPKTEKQNKKKQFGENLIFRFCEQTPKSAFSHNLDWNSALILTSPA